MVSHPHPTQGFIPSPVQSPAMSSVHAELHGVCSHTVQWPLYVTYSAMQLCYYLYVALSPGPARKIGIYWLGPGNEAKLYVHGSLKP